MYLYMNKPSYLKDAVFLLIYIFTSHSSIVTMEIYAKSSLRRLENDFPSLVNSTKNTQIWEKGHTFEGHTSNAVPVSSIISGVSTS